MLLPLPGTWEGQPSPRSEPSPQWYQGHPGPTAGWLSCGGLSASVEEINSPLRCIVTARCVKLVMSSYCTVKDRLGRLEPDNHRPGNERNRREGVIR